MAKNIRMPSPLYGTMIPLNECPDPVFASGAMGRGIAIKNPDCKVYAPFDGEVTVLFPTGHAICLKSNSGIELLIHIGMDTVKMNGEGFTAWVEPGEVVKRGQLLIEFDLDAIKKTVYETTTPVVVTNHADFGDITFELDSQTITVKAADSVVSTREKNSTGGKSLDTKLTILGETGSGKTCYLLGMYYEMSAGRDGYSIIAPNRDESRRLVANFRNLKDASLGTKRFPEPTDTAQKYQFELQHAFNTILPFEWIDYPGGWLDVSKSAGSELREVENSIYNSTALFICIDGENLTGNNTAEKIERVRDKSSRHISQYLGQMLNKSGGKNFPPIAIIVTKYDLCNRDTTKDEIREILEKSFSPLFMRNDTFIVIVPVSLGSDLQDDDSRGKFQPINLHLPIYMGIWFALKNYIKDREESIKQLQRDISNYKDLIRDEEGSFFLFRSDDNIKLWRQRKSECESRIQQLQNEIDAVKESYASLERELYSVKFTFINGRWHK